MCSRSVFRCPRLFATRNVFAGNVSSGAHVSSLCSPNMCVVGQNAHPQAKAMIVIVIIMTIARIEVVVVVAVVVVIEVIVVVVVVVVVAVVE